MDDPFDRFLDRAARQKKRDKGRPKRAARKQVPMQPEPAQVRQPLVPLSTINASPGEKDSGLVSSESSAEDESPRDSAIETDLDSEDQSMTEEDDGVSVATSDLGHDQKADDGQVSQRGDDYSAIESDPETELPGRFSAGPSAQDALVDSMNDVLDGLDPYAKQEMVVIFEEVEKVHKRFRESTAFIATFGAILAVFGWFPILILLFIMAALGVGANAPALGAGFGALTGTVLYAVYGFKNRHRYVFGEWRGVWWGLSLVALVVWIGSDFAAGWWYFQFCNSTDPANSSRSIQVACEDNPGYLLGIFIVLLVLAAAQLMIFITQCVIGAFAQSYERMYEEKVKSKGNAKIAAFRKYIALRNKLLNKANEGGFGLSSFYYSDPFPKSDV